jgi:hypothetical protein
VMWKTRNYKDIETQAGLVIGVFTAAAFLSITSFFLPSSFNIISWGHQGIIMVVSLNIILLMFYVKISDFCCERKIKSLAKVLQKYAYPGLFVAFLVLLLVNVPFLYARLVQDPQTLVGSYELYSITSQSDYSLLQWMKANLSSNAIVMVNPEDSGLFIPSVSHQKIIYPWTASSYTLSYETLVNLIRDHVLNETTYDLMKGFNITDIFIGSNATDWWTGDFTWDPYLFLGNPNFKLIQNFSTSYLFQFCYDPNLADVVFSDDITSPDWTAGGWQVSFNGNGQGTVNATADNWLNITSQAAFTVSGCQHATCISREIYVLNDSEIDLSFNLNATQGFDRQDTFAAIVSDNSGNQTLVFPTPNSTYENYSNSKPLKSYEGSFEFSGKNSLSSLWMQAYNSPLPSSFKLEFVNLDFNGIENTAYLGNVTVTCIPTFG